jgi:Domain of unknown function (DUF5671)
MSAIVVRRSYFYAAALLGLELLAVGLSDLFAALLERLFAPAVVGTPELAAMRLSLSVALVIVGLPLWAIHWSVAQSMARRPDEQHARLRRLYGYLVLFVAVLTVLFALRDLFAALFGAVAAEQAGVQVATAIAGIVVQSSIWAYHWRVFSADRAVVEPVEGTATLRRWYMLLAQAISLSLASVAAIVLIHQLLQLILVPAIDARSGVGESLAMLIAALAIWLPHHLWADWLVRAPSPLRADELRSTLRQVYLALVITATAVAALGGLATLLYAALLAGFGGAAWQSLLIDHTGALATVIIAAPLWVYHRRQLANEARMSAQAARLATAQHIIGYLMAAIGLAALFFGLGELLSTLLRMVLAPDVFGVGWREPLSRALALTVVALPVYGITAQAMERRAHATPAEERTLARRVYLYAALLFGIATTVIAVVTLLRLVLSALLGAPASDLPLELGRWLGYTLPGAAIAVLYTLQLRRASVLQSDIGAGITIAIIADEPLRHALVAACAREASKATILSGGADAPAPTIAAISAADMLVVTLALALDGPLAASIHAFGGRRLLLATDTRGYDIIGPRRSDAALVRATAQAVRATVSAKVSDTVAPEAPVVAAV